MLAPVRIDGHELQPRDEIHRRKLEALRVFVERLLASPARDQIAKIILFGSVARGEAQADSDVDVMVYGFGDLKRLRDFAYDAHLDLGEYTGEGIEDLYDDISEWSEPHDYFTYSVRHFGKEIHTVSDTEIKRAEAIEFLELAQEYLGGAERALNASDVRLAADGAYNAAELCVKGLLLFKMDVIPGSHSGLVDKFGELYAKPGIVPRELGKRLHEGLKVRSWARYKRTVIITPEMAQNNLVLAREFIALLEHKLQEANGSDEQKNHP